MIAVSRESPRCPLHPAPKTPQPSKSPMDAQNRAARLGAVATRAALAVFVAAAALSCAQLAPTSRPAPVVERASASRQSPLPATAPPPATQSTAPEVSVFPLAPQPPVESESAPEATTPDAPRIRQAPAATSDAVALILPLEIPAYARAAEAVRAGFLAAAEKAGEQAKVVVIAHKEDGILAAFEHARARA